MKQVAEQFLQKLKEGSTNSAINVIKEGFETKIKKSLLEKQQQVLADYGFEAVQLHEEQAEDESKEEDEEKTEDESKKDKEADK